MKEWQAPKDNNLKIDFTINSNSPALNRAVADLEARLNCSTLGGSKHNKFLELTVENLLLAYKRGEQFRISYPRGRSFYSRDGFRVDKQKNPRGISYKLVHYVDLMAAHGYLETQKGFFDTSNPSSSCLARMKPTQKFVMEIIVPYELYHLTLSSRLRHPQIVVKKNDGSSSHKYDADLVFTQMAKKVAHYNEFYRDLEIGFIDPRLGCKIEPEGKTVHRVFNEDSLAKGGRFYGAWWQQKSENDRKLIRIEGKETVELDYAGAHIGLLYGMAGTEMPASLASDPYNLPALPRNLVKLCILRALNTPTPRNAWMSVSHELFLNEAPRLEYSAFEAIMEAFYKQHPPIRDLFFQGGLSYTLQYLDSVVADRVLEDMIIKQGKAVLAIHDSFVAKKEDTEALNKAMIDAYKKSHDPRIQLGFTSIKDKGSKKV